MTGQQIYEIASSFLYERDNEDIDSKEFAVGFLNILLQEALPYENSIRAWNDQGELKKAQYLTSLNEEIEYDDAIVRTAFPYGLASWYFQEAMDNFQAENYRNKYISALTDAQKYKLTKIVDVYGGGEDA